MTPKDNFSKQSALYAAFRPEYPQELYDFILKHVTGRQAAWDCGTGNGQVAKILSRYFERVEATDISQAQLDKAVQLQNVFYSLSPAEVTKFPDSYFDLITVAQAIHWFDFEKFYKEVTRVAKPDALLAVWGYGLLRTNDKDVNEKIGIFYKEIIGPYWDAERRHIDEHYKTIPFLKNEITTPEFYINVEWTMDQLEGYLNTWSSVQKFIRMQQHNPVTDLMKEVRKLYPEGDLLNITFPVFLRMAKII